MIYKNEFFSTAVIPLDKNIVRISHFSGETPPPPSCIMCEDFTPTTGVVSCCQPQKNALLFLREGRVVCREANHSLREKTMYTTVIDAEPVIRKKLTANGEVSYIENARRVDAGTAYEGTLTFEVSEDCALYGLGQHEDGVYDYRNQEEYLYQNNMKTPLPVLLASDGYAIVLDSETAVIFRSEQNRVTFTLDTVDHLSYYVIVGANFDEIIGSLRTLTGRAVMLPRWAFGYIQSKERYRSADELTKTARRFRREKIPVDCLVQDWYSWKEGHWGEKLPDPARYPDPPGLLEQLHRDNIRLMVSVWPNMAQPTQDYREFAQKGMLLPNSAVYNAYDEEARALYWQQCERKWFAAGTDAWWCDNTEPFSDADWNGEQKRAAPERYRLVTEESKKSMDWRTLNTYGFMHAKGIYQNWRRSGCGKRVVNLTRSTYLGSQRYATISWSGDISANWETLRRQITAGLQFSLSGMPYWTLDIGAFFTVKDKWENRGCEKAGDDTRLWFWNGDYNDGVRDLGYRELYVRWFETAAFLPVFRSHGTDTPREPWHFGKAGEPFYDALLAFIRLRYRLLPYIYSCAAAVTLRNQTMLRSLLFDFAADQRCRGISDCFMLGKALLVCPVTKPMYYGPNSTPLENVPKTRTVYLPSGCDWIDFWTNRRYGGGTELCCDAPLERIPLFVRAGSILPLSEELEYADQQGGRVSCLQVYPGADGSFVLYNDEGDGYSYEQGNYSAVPLTYCHGQQSLSFGAAQGSYPFQRQFEVRWVGADGAGHRKQVDYNGSETCVVLD